MSSCSVTSVLSHELSCAMSSSGVCGAFLAAAGLAGMSGPGSVENMRGRAVAAELNSGVLAEPMLGGWPVRKEPWWMDTGLLLYVTELCGC